MGTIRILGIDPGSTATGYGVVDHDGGRLVHVAHGTLRPGRRASLAARLLALQRGLEDVIRQHEPDVAAVEQVFVASSPRSALILGQARGVALAAVATRELPLHEYDARRVKQAVSAYGAASKAQVRYMIGRLLQLERTPATDAADALATAICHAHHHRLKALGASSRRWTRPARRRAGPRVRRAP